MDAEEKTRAPPPPLDDLEAGVPGAAGGGRGEGGVEIPVARPVDGDGLVVVAAKAEEGEFTLCLRQTRRGEEFPPPLF